MKNVMRRAWEIYRRLTGDRLAKLSMALKRAWAEKKKKNAENAEKVITVHYSVYKNQYSNFETVKNSYNKVTKTIDIIVPVNEEKCKIKQLESAVGSRAGGIVWGIKDAMKKTNNNVEKAMIRFELDNCGYTNEDICFFFKRLGLVK